MGAEWVLDNDEYGKNEEPDQTATYGPAFLLESFHHPDITTLGLRRSESNPFPVRRPHRIINAHAGVREFEHLLRRCSLQRSDPQNFVSDKVHDARAIEEPPQLTSTRDAQ